jgi:transposase InsO family protein
MQFLEDYFADGAVPPSGMVEVVRSHVAVAPGITLDNLLSAVSGCCSCDDVYWLIARDQLFVDLRAARLSEPTTVKVFSDTAAAEVARQPRLPSTVPGGAAGFIMAPGTLVAWDAKPWRIVNVGATAVSLLGDGQSLSELPAGVFQELVRAGRIVAPSTTPLPGPNHEALEHISKASEAELRRANLRYECVCRFLQGYSRPEELSIPARTLRRWVSAYRQAERVLGSGFLGLLSNIAQRGNTTSKLPEATKALMTEFIERDYETLKQKTKRASWLALRLGCEEKRLIPPSYKTFSLAIRQRPGYEQTLKRQGHRAAYEQEPFYWELNLKTPRHGDRPFEIGHIDHTELDVELVCSMTGQNFRRPWLSILTDAFSRRFLAFFLTFDTPSYRSCMMVLRQCVFRHGRLPQIVVVDGGREFESTYFETLLARYECIKKTRPPAKARFGSLCERLFGTANTQFIHNLQGNTQISRNVRQVTKGVNPQGQAVWMLKELQEHLAAYCYEVYDTMDHPALGRSPRDAFQAGLAATGQRPHRMIPYDREFMIYTLPTTARGTAIVSPGRGVKVHYLYYWCEAFRRADIEKTHVEVRYDPFDVGTAFAFVDGRWTECIGEYHHVFQGHSQKEVMLAAEELRQRRQNHAQRFPVTAKKLAELLKGTEITETILKQRIRDLEVARAYSDIRVGATGACLPTPSGSNSGASLDADNEEPEDPPTAPEIYAEF